MVPEGVRVKLLLRRLAALQRLPTALHERAFTITPFSWPVVPPGRHGELLRKRHIYSSQIYPSRLTSDELRGRFEDLKLER